MFPVIGWSRWVRRPVAARLILIVALSVAGCAPASLPAPPSRLLDPSAFALAVAEPDRLTINVHVPFEGRLDGTDLEIPFDRVVADAARLPADRGAPLALYCKSGRMSALAAADLARLGFRDVVELAGGMEAWVEEGRSLRTTEVFPAAPPMPTPAAPPR